MTPEAYWDRFADWMTGPLVLPDGVRSRAGLAFIDTMAAILAGIGQPASHAARAVALETGAGPAAVAGGGRSAAPMAAFANATSGHALDFDDYDRPSVGHPSVVLVPAVLAEADARVTTGAAALAAYAVGVEVMDRLGEMVNPAQYERGFHTTGLLGAVGAAAAGARLKGLDARQGLMALSIAAGSASGLKAQFGSSAKALTAGIAAKTGLFAARLAEAGAEGNPRAIWGVAGFAGLFGAADSSTSLPSRPGAPFALEEYGMVVKRWPCCGYLGRILSLAEDLSREVDAGDIERIEIEAPPRNADVIPFDLPASPDEARFSAPYTVAVMLLSGNVTPADFTPRAIARDDIRSLARRITLIRSGRPQSAEDLSPADPDVVRVTLRDGRLIERVQGPLPGAPEAPFDRGAHLDKLASCAHGHLCAADAARLGQTLDRFADLDSVAPVTSLMEQAR